MDACSFCGNRHFVEATIQYTYKRDGQYLIVDDVPCTQCAFCGEAYLQAKVLKKIEAEFEAIHKHGKKPKRAVTVPVEGFLELGAA
jgi:YgiT-type zinc finger domain-containing protein